MRWRKRLAQYYYESEHQHELRIELHPGSYVPAFRLAGKDDRPFDQSSEPPALALPETALSAPSQFSPVIDLPAVPQDHSIDEARLEVRRWKRLALVACLALIPAIIGATLPLFHRPSSTDLFWRPVVDGEWPGADPPSPSVVAMVNSNAVAPSPSTVSGHPLASDPIAVSDATALSSIQQVLSIRSKTSALESSTSTSFSDLQRGPVVLISGFNNQWTMRITDPLRFHFVRTSTDDYTIQDRSDAAHVWGINTAGPFVQMDRDYGLVARFHDPTTEQVVVVAAGIGENGTIVASKFLTDEKYLAELKESHLLPRPDQNFEAILETQIIDGKPGPPRVIAHLPLVGTLCKARERTEHRLYFWQYTALQGPRSKVCRLSSQRFGQVASRLWIHLPSGSDTTRVPAEAAAQDFDATVIAASPISSTVTPASGADAATMLSPALNNEAATLISSAPIASRPGNLAGSGAVLLEVGTVLGGRYELLKLLVQGGMGAVYKACDREVDRTVALKVIRPEMAANPEILARFKQELLLSSQVTHRNVIRIYDLGEAQGVKFITMEFVDGEDLHHLLKERCKLGVAEAVDLMEQVTSGLAARAPRRHHPP